MSYYYLDGRSEISAAQPRLGMRESLASSTATLFPLRRSYEVAVSLAYRRTCTCHTPWRTVNGDSGKGNHGELVLSVEAEAVERDAFTFC